MVAISVFNMNIFGNMTSNLLRGPVTSDSSPGGGPVNQSDEASSLSPGEGVGRDGLKGTKKQKEQDREPNEPKDEQKKEQEASASEDAMWVEKAQQGDTRAFDRLVTKHRGKFMP